MNVHFHGLVQGRIQIARDRKSNNMALQGGIGNGLNPKCQLFQMIWNHKFGLRQADRIQTGGKGERCDGEGLVFRGFVVDRDVRADGFVLMDIDIGGCCVFDDGILSPIVGF